MVDVSVEELRKYSLFVGTPMYGGNCAGIFTKSTNDLAATCASYGIPLKFYYLFNESLIPRARNYIVDEFMRSGCSHMLFIDADIGFLAGDVLVMLAHQISQPEKYDIVCAPYTKKTIAWEKIKLAIEKGVINSPEDLALYAGDFVFNIDNDGEDKTYSLSEPFPVHESGTGFMLIPRKVFEKYSEAYPEYKYIPDHARSENFNGTTEIMAYFDSGIDEKSRRYLSEDYFFCRKAKSIGINIHMCPWIDLSHVGSYIYKGSVSHLASIGATVTASPINKNEETIIQ